MLIKLLENNFEWIKKSKKYDKTTKKSKKCQQRVNHIEE